MKMRSLLIATLVTVFSGSIVVYANSDELLSKVTEELAHILGPAPLPPHPLEKIEPNEDQDFLKIAGLMFKIQMTLAPSVRDAHAKGHGCVTATFKVDEQIPPFAQSGFLAVPGKAYSSLIRFSNGTMKAGVADTDKDARGMAIKLIDSDLKKNLLGTGNNQDFLLINNDRFFIRNTKDYLAFQVAIATNKGDPASFILERAIHEALDGYVTLTPETLAEIKKTIAEYKDSKIHLVWNLGVLLGPIDAGFLLVKLNHVSQRTAPLELEIVSEMLKNIESSLAESYFSMSSYALGTTAVKYVTRPESCDRTEVRSNVATSDSDFLRKDLIARVASKDHCFGFYVQPLPNVAQEEKVRLVEDATQRFNTKEIRVATIHIPRQDVSQASKASYCENLSFNPWQAQPENRPLGSMNRARRFAVTASSIRRHFVNSEERKEPSSIKEFEALQ